MNAVTKTGGRVATSDAASGVARAVVFLQMLNTMVGKPASVEKLDLLSRWLPKSVDPAVLDEEMARALSERFRWFPEYQPLVACIRELTAERIRIGEERATSGELAGLTRSDATMIRLYRREAKGSRRAAIMLDLIRRDYPGAAERLAEAGDVPRLPPPTPEQREAVSGVLSQLHSHFASRRRAELEAQGDRPHYLSDAQIVATGGYRAPHKRESDIPIF